MLSAPPNLSLRHWAFTWAKLEEAQAKRKTLRESHQERLAAEVAKQSGKTKEEVLEQFTAEDDLATRMQEKGEEYLGWAA